MLEIYCTISDPRIKAVIVIIALIHSKACTWIANVAASSC